MPRGTLIGVLLISAAALADIKVTQSPQNIEVRAGMKIHLSCSFNRFAEFRIFSHHWYKQGLGREKSAVTNTSAEFIGRVLKETQGSKTNITILDAKQNDSGTYYCEVEIFNFARGTGIGTRVTVKVGPDNTMDSHSSVRKKNLIILASVLGGIVLILSSMALLVVLHFCKHRDRTPAAQTQEQGVTSNNIVYADLHINKPKTHGPGSLRKDRLASPPSRAFEQEDAVVYATVRPVIRKKNKQRAPVRPPNEMEEAVVYGRIRTPVHNDVSGME
ncbi:uncharacterized protein [Heterodontus francisci]|uniref:uncharacterized protein n=1 Tax=Heterodontus francisci TaxID=7792 RepID=UPI00355C376A